MIRFSKYITLYFIISAFVLVPGVYSLIRYGLRPSIDFTGGTLLEIEVPTTITKNDLTETAKKVMFELVGIQETKSHTYLLRAKPESNEKTTAYLQALMRDTKAEIKLLRNETVGPVLGGELLKKALIAAALAMTGILFYVAYAFKNISFGISAIIALIHDLLVVMGIFSLLGHFQGVEVDTLFVTAVLTTMSFSVHDTIVVFDRIREMTKKGTRGKFEDIADLALSQTISRSVANSVTIIIMLLALTLLGGESIRWFAVALLIGTISGTYSSPFVATPLSILIKRYKK